MSVAAAQGTIVAPTSAMAQVTDAMQTFVEAKKVAGSIAIVSHRDQIVYFDAVGKRDIANDLPMQRDTIVRIYSMTKPITAVAAMMLVEEKKLGLDDPVHKHLPELKDVKVLDINDNGDLELEEPQTEMTVRDLFRHTSGFTYGVFGDSSVDKQYRAAKVLDRDSTLAQMVTKLSKLPLLNQPGTKLNYSVSSDVLGRIVEVVSGSPLDQFFDARIFQPLKMVDTGFSVPDEKLGRFSDNFSRNPSGGLVVIDAADTSDFRKPPKLLSGGHGLVSTAGDYMRFCRMLLNEGQLDGKRLLREETVAEMSRDQLPAAAFPISILGQVRAGVGFGLGFSVIVDKTDHTAADRLDEYGWGGAASTHFWISPQDDLAVVVLTQFMPYTPQMEVAVKPVVYRAINVQP